MDILLWAMKVFATAMNLFSTGVLTLAIWLYIWKLSPITYLHNVKLLMGCWILVAIVNFAGGLLDVVKFAIGLDLLFNLVGYSEGLFLAFWVISMHIRMRELYRKKMDEFIVRTTYGKY